jgi:hypothetical protein
MALAKSSGRANICSMNGTSEEEGPEVNDKSARYTAESLEFTAAQLERVVTDLRAGVGILSAAKLKTIDVPYGESSRKVGLQRLKSWADTVRDAIDGAADAAFQSVSDAPPDDGKRRQKK